MLYDDSMFLPIAVYQNQPDPNLRKNPHQAAIKPNINIGSHEASLNGRASASIENRDSNKNVTLENIPEIVQGYINPNKILNQYSNSIS